MSIIASQPGVYDVAAAGGVVLGQYIFSLTGTGWAERSPAGTRFYLENPALDGNAVDEIQMGNAAGTMGNGVAFTPQGINTIVGTPMIKWIWDTSANGFYKVLNVINDNTIEVEAVRGATGLQLAAIATRGYGVKSVAIVPPDGGNIDYHGYTYDASPVASKTFTAVQIYTDIDANGPYYFTGSAGAVTVNADTSHTRLS